MDAFDTLLNRKARCELALGGRSAGRYLVSLERLSSIRVPLLQLKAPYPNCGTAAVQPNTKVEVKDGLGR